MKTTHTPGPWTVGDPTLTQHDYPKRHESESVSIHAPGRACVATVYGGHEGGSVGRPYVSLHDGRANARLIAAAPELLAACRYALALFSSYEPDTPEAMAHAMVSAVIAKAEGRT
jgi:hypothetical protein